MAKILNTAGSITYKKRKPLAVIIGIICAGMIVVSGVCLYIGFSRYKDAKNTELVWDEMANIAGISDSEGTRMASSSSQNTYTGPYESVDLEALKAVNSDVSGYICIPDTTISYPLLAESKKGKYFYIDHNIYKDKDKYGSIFELSSDEKGVNSGINWIFGHHMTSGAMFTPLYDYEDEAFIDREVRIYRDNYVAVYDVAACCKVESDDPVYSFGSYPLGSELYDMVLDRIKEKSVVLREDRFPDKDTPITILSTCYGRTGTSVRLIVALVEKHRYYFDTGEIVTKGVV